ncbi:MAG: radical SAM protein, partial [bacterium]|nr:radical SAM protein [bacterium]
MHDTLPLLLETDFPRLSRRSLGVLQVNLGYRCNQTCVHCHVNAGPHRQESMSRETAEQVLELVRAHRPHTVYLTGGAPELHEQFRFLVAGVRELGVR